jgi:hypothetical protein
MTVVKISTIKSVWEDLLLIVLMRKFWLYWTDILSIGLDRELRPVVLVWQHSYCIYMTALASDGSISCKFSMC